VVARRVAVLLNRRAQGVTEARVQWFREQVAPDDLIVTDDVDAGRAAVKQIARAGYDVLVLGGGDGTVMASAEALVGEPHMPALLPLRLGHEQRDP
jgi:diacylglycerol kinase family enzyme